MRMHRGDSQCGCGRSMYADELALKKAIVDQITYDLSEEDLGALHNLFIGEGKVVPDLV